MTRTQLRNLVRTIGAAHPGIEVTLQPQLIVTNDRFKDRLFQVDIALRVTSSICYDPLLRVRADGVGDSIEREITLLMQLAPTDRDLVIRAERLMRVAPPSRVAFARRWLTPPIGDGEESVVPLAAPTPPSAAPVTLWERLEFSELEAVPEGQDLGPIGTPPP